MFDIIAGRYSGNIPNMDVWFKGHSGDMIRVDRKGRAPEYIRKPAMTLGLMIQPEVLKTIAAQPSFRGRGLIARFLYAMPVSNVGTARPTPDAVPDAVLKAYDTVIRGLAKGLQKAKPDDDPDVLKLTPEAMAAIATIEAETELALREDGPLASLRDWGGKYVAAVARIAGLLHLAEHGGAKGLKESGQRHHGLGGCRPRHLLQVRRHRSVRGDGHRSDDCRCRLSAGQAQAAPDRHHLRARHAARRPEVPEEGRPVGGDRRPWSITAGYSPRRPPSKQARAGRRHRRTKFTP